MTIVGAITSVIVTIFDVMYVAPIPRYDAHLTRSFSVPTSSAAAASEADELAGDMGVERVRRQHVTDDEDLRTPLTMHKVTWRR